MNQSALPRPPPIPASPHVKDPFCLQMVREDGGPGGKGQWPPVRSIPGAPRPHDFLAKCATEGGKRVAWPPHLSSTEDLSGDGEIEQPQSFPKRTFPPQQTQNEGPNQTTTYPSGFKLRDEPPMEHVAGVQVVPAQPAFKITQPMRVKGDAKWPPTRGTTEEGMTSEQVREFTKPKKTNRDYMEFFEQNALPNQYPAYRAPPGTQHKYMEQE